MKVKDPEAEDPEAEEPETEEPETEEPEAEEPAAAFTEDSRAVRQAALKERRRATHRAGAGIESEPAAEGAEQPPSPSRLKPEAPVQLQPTVSLLDTTAVLESALLESMVPPRPPLPPTRRPAWTDGEDEDSGFVRSNRTHAVACMSLRLSHIADGTMKLQVDDPDSQDEEVAAMEVAPREALLLQVATGLAASRDATGDATNSNARTAAAHHAPSPVPPEVAAAAIADWTEHDEAAAATGEAPAAVGDGLESPELPAEQHEVVLMTAGGAQALAEMTEEEQLALAMAISLEAEPQATVNAEPQWVDA